MSELEMRGYAVLLERVKSIGDGAAVAARPVVQRPVAHLRRRGVLLYTGEV